MPSASSSRYQSKLFNFVNQQSRRLTKQYDRAVQQVRVATSWAIPVILYPFYVIFQGTRAVVKQLSPPAGSSSPQLPASNRHAPPQSPPSTDTPIQQVLQSLQNQNLENLRIQNSQICQYPTSGYICGIATELATQNLVVVTAENETLDVFTPQQQEELQARIIEEIAVYWRYQRLLHSQQAASADKIASPEVLDVLDRGVAKLESNYLAPASEVAITLSQKSQELALGVQKQLNGITFASPGDSEGITNSHSKSYALRFQALIFAAVDYFFGTHPQQHLKDTTPTAFKKLPTTPPQRKPLPYQRPNAKLPSAKSPTIADPWLTLDDLFGAQPEPQVTPTPPNRVVAKTSNYLPDNLQSRRQQLPNTTRSQPSKTAMATPARSAIATPTRKLDKSSSPAKQQVAAPKYIETKATPVGYVKHPLEQLLEWLDRGMLSLESKLIALWQRLRRLWHK